MKKIDFKNSSFVIFLIISLFYAINNFIWWKLNTPIISEGMSAFHFTDVFQNQILYFNAPLITWIMKCMFFIFGKEYFDLQVIFVNYIFFIIALYCIYKIGIELKDKETGNIAMILFALSPVIYGMSRQYGHQDWHVMVAMTANIYCLIKLNDFKDRKWSILYGMTVGLGLLIKDEFLPYFFTPWLYVVIRSLIEKIEPRKIINILITIAIGSLIAGCHYFRMEIITKILREPIVETASIFSFESLKFMTINLGEELLSLLLFVLSIFGFIWLLIRYKNRNKYIFVLWFIIPWAIVTFMPHHKQIEYCIGLVPVMILFSSVLISNFKNILLKRFFLMFVILICLLQFFCFSFGEKHKFFCFKNEFNKYNKLIYNKYIDLAIQLKPYLNTQIYFQKNNLDRFALNFIIYIMNDKDSFFEVYDYYDIDLFYIKRVKKDISVEEINKFFDNTTIVVCCKQYSTLDIAEHIYYYDVDSFGKNDEYKKMFIQNTIERIEPIRKYIDNNFSLRETFYIGNMKDEDHLIKVYTKNNK